jgi:hypothetical protein
MPTKHSSGFTLRTRVASGALALSSLAACSAQRNAPAHGPTPTSAAESNASASSAPPAEASKPSPTAASTPIESPTSEPCGALECRLFDSAEAAFVAVLAEKPLVLAVGEAHAQKDAPKVPSTAVRFGRQLLPAIPKSRASDLVIELLIPDPTCRPKVEAVQNVEAQVTKPQAVTNQNEYVALGSVAKSLGIRPHALDTTCADYDDVLKAGDDGVVEMLKLIRRRTQEIVDKLGESNASAADPPMVVTYGGAMHNDLSPKPGLEEFSFGHGFQASTHGRYIELDLIVPEFIKDTENWRGLAWHAHFDPKRAPEKATLFRTGPNSFVLIFPRTGS